MKKPVLIHSRESVLLVSYAYTMEGNTCKRSIVKLKLNYSKYQHLMVFVLTVNRNGSFSCGVLSRLSMSSVSKQFRNLIKSRS